MIINKSNSIGQEIMEALLGIATLGLVGCSSEKPESDPPRANLQCGKSTYSNPKSSGQMHLCDDKSANRCKSKGLLYGMVCDGNNPPHEEKVICSTYQEGTECVAGKNGAECKVPDSYKQNAHQIAATLSGTCSLQKNGRVYCWGDNEYGQIGNGSLSDSSVPSLVNSIQSVVKISAGGDAVCALRGSGDMYCWGRNDSGQLGDGSFENRNLPTKVPGLCDIVDFSVAKSGVCAVHASGTVYCWGQGQWGARGDGKNAPSLLPYPTQVVGLKDVVNVTSSGLGSCAVTQSEDVYCWGENPLYGLPGQDVNKLTPSKVEGFNDVLKVCLGDDFGPVCAISRSGDVYCAQGSHFGPSFGLLKHITGIDNPTDILSLFDEVCAILESGLVQCWNASSVPKVISAPDFLGLPVMSSPDYLSNVATISRGFKHICVLKKSGEVFCSGSNLKGQLGAGTNGNWSFKEVKVNFN